MMKNGSIISYVQSPARNFAPPFKFGIENLRGSEPSFDQAMKWATVTIGWKISTGKNHSPEFNIIV